MELQIFISHINKHIEENKIGFEMQRCKTAFWTVPEKCEKEEVRANGSGHGPSMWGFGDVVTTVREKRGSLHIYRQEWRGRGT